METNKNKLEQLGLVDGAVNGMLTDDKQLTDKKELKGTDYAVLRYLAMNLNIAREEYGMSMEEIDNTSSIQNNELYLWDFDGFPIDENLTLRTLYLNKFNRPMASVHDEEKNAFLDYIID